MLDDANGEAIADAIVELAADAHCTAIPVPDTFTRPLQRTVTHAGREGRFVAGGGFGLLFPRCWGWETTLAVFAPGYYGARAPVRDSIGLGWPWPVRFIVPVTIRLRRLHYTLQLTHDEFRHASSSPDRRLDEELDTRLKALRYRAAGRHGVFASEPGAHFDRVEATTNGLSVASSATGAVRAWDADGTAVGAPDPEATDLLASTRTAREIARLHEWIDASHSRLAAENDALDALFRDEARFECTAEAGPLSQRAFVVITLQDHGHVLTYVDTLPFDRAGRHVFRKSLAIPWDRPERITACAFDRQSIYVAFAGAGIRRYTVAPGDTPLREEPFWMASRDVTIDVPGGPLTFVDLALGALRTDFPSSRNAVYAVTGGSEIYRFDTRGEPDQRFELE